MKKEIIKKFFISLFLGIIITILTLFLNLKSTNVDWNKCHCQGILYRGAPIPMIKMEYSYIDETLIPINANGIYLGIIVNIIFWSFLSMKGMDWYKNKKQNKSN